MVQYMTEVDQQVAWLHLPTLTGGSFLNTHGQHIIPVLTEKARRWSLEQTNTASQQHCLQNMDEIPPHIFSSGECMSWAVSKISEFPE